MPTIIPPGFAQVFWRWSVAGDAEEMLTSCGVRTVGSPVDPQSLANEMVGAWTAAFPASDLSNSYTFVGTRVYVGNDGDPLVAETNVSVPGTSSSAFLPSNCAVLVQKRTGVSGRRNRGRFFIPAGYIPEGGVDVNGNIAAPTIGTIQGNFNDLYTDLTTTTPVTDQVVVLHSTPPSQPTVVTSFQVASKIATQRKRMRR